MFFTAESVRVRLRIVTEPSRYRGPLRFAFWQPPLVGASTSQGGPEFRHIVGGANQRLFPADLSRAAQQELVEPAVLLDLTEHRFHDRFPLGIETPPPFGPCWATQLLW